MNKVLLTGYIYPIGKADELIITGTNNAVLNFNVSLQRSYTIQETGSRKTEYIYVNCVAYRQNAEFIKRNFHKGSPISIEGHLNTRNYTDKDTNKVIYITEVVVDTVEFVPRDKGDNQQDNQYQNNNYQGNYQNNNYQNNNYQGSYQNNGFQRGNSGYNGNGFGSSKQVSNQNDFNFGPQDFDSYPSIDNDIDDDKDGLL